MLFFGDMASMYTKCDYKIEQQCLASRKIVFGLVKDFYETYQKIREQLLGLQDRLWVISQRYLILLKGTPGVQPYPADVTEYTQCEHLSDWSKTLRETKKSTKLIKETIKEIEDARTRFDIDFRKVDLTVDSPFVRECALQGPTCAYMAAIDELLDLFKNYYSMLKTIIANLDIANVQDIEKFKEIIEDINLNRKFKKVLSTIAKIKRAAQAGQQPA